MENTKFNKNKIIPNILEVDQVSVLYQRRNKKFLAVDNVSFNIKKGEIFGLVGESGCGKTTIARSVIGLVPYRIGLIKINDHIVNKTTFSNKMKKNLWQKTCKWFFKILFLL